MDFQQHFFGMTSADTSAVPFDPPVAERKGLTLRRLLAPFAVGIALLSAFLTFVVLTGLTPIEPTRDVVRSFLLINAATILLLVGIIVRELWQVVQARRRACIIGSCGKSRCRCSPRPWRRPAATRYGRPICSASTAIRCGRRFAISTFKSTGAEVSRTDKGVRTPLFPGLLNDSC